MAKDEERERRGGAAVLSLGSASRSRWFWDPGQLAQALLVGLAFTGGTYGFVRLAGPAGSADDVEPAVARASWAWPPPGSEEPGPEVTPAEGLLGLIPGVYSAPAASAPGAPSERLDPKMEEASMSAGVPGPSGSAGSNSSGGTSGARQRPAGGGKPLLAALPPLAESSGGFHSGASLGTAAGAAGARRSPATDSASLAARDDGEGAARAEDALTAARRLAAARPAGAKGTASREAGTGRRLLGRGQSRLAASFSPQGRGDGAAALDGGAGYAAAGTDSALGQLRTANGLSRSAAGQMGESASQTAGAPFDGGTAGTGGFSPTGSSGGGADPGSGAPSGSGTPIGTEDAAPAPLPESPPGRNLTPYQSWVTLAQYLLLAASIVLFVAFLLSRTVFGASWAQPVARLAAVLAAGAAAAGVAIMSQGQHLQGAIYTFSGAALAYLSWTAPFGDPRAANGGEAAAAAAAPPSEQASGRLAASQLEGNKTWWATKTASQLPATADSSAKP